MKRKFLKWLYENNKPIFGEFMVEDFYGSIPESVKNPAMDFLSSARTKLEKFFSIQAYHIQKKTLGDRKNSQFWEGQLAYIKSFILALSRTAAVKPTDPTFETKDDSLEGVKAFASGIVEFFNGPKEK